MSPENLTKKDCCSAKRIKFEQALKRSRYYERIAASRGMSIHRNSDRLCQFIKALSLFMIMTDNEKFEFTMEGLYAIVGTDGDIHDLLFRSAKLGIIEVKTDLIKGFLITLIKFPRKKKKRSRR